MKMGQKQSALTSEEINDMKLLTRLSTEDILAFHKEFTKDFPKGRLTKEDMKKLYKKTFPDGNPDDVVKELFRVYDMDNSGTIDFREFLAGIGVMSRGNEEQKLRVAFEMYDADGNGSISKAEIRSLVNAIYKASAGDKHNPKSADNVGAHLFQQLDKNKDNRVSLQEFIDGAKSDPTIIGLVSDTQPELP